MTPYPGSLMKPSARKMVLPDLRLYLITQRNLFPQDRFLDKVEQVLQAGIRDVQLREKDLSPKELFRLAQDLRRLTQQYDARLFINDRVDIALLAGADGVHLPENGVPCGAVKKAYPQLLVGKSTHSLIGAQEAENQGADFITFSPIFDTPSKREFGPPQGIERLREVTQAVTLPVLALGGITCERVPEILETGAQGIALISGIWKQPNLETAVNTYRTALKMV